jgi:hypothetical protein
MRALVDFGPFFIFRRVTIPVERVLNSSVRVRPSGEAFSTFSRNLMLGIKKKVSHIKFHSVPDIPTRILREDPLTFLRAWAFTSLLCANALFLSRFETIRK